MKALTREQIREIDRQAIENYGIPGVVLMENAGRNATAEIVKHAARSEPLSVLIFCGAGNNGGDGFVIARHLHNLGHQVNAVLVGAADKLAPDARINYDIAAKMDLAIHTFDENHARDLALQADVLVDALLGTGFRGEVRSPLDSAIHIMNESQPVIVVAIDVPSGLDCNSGQPAQATVCANLTVTFVAPKTGFSIEPAAEYTGQIVVADIGAPREIILQGPSR